MSEKQVVKMIVKHIYSCRGCTSCNTLWASPRDKYICTRTKNYIEDIDTIPEWCPLPDTETERQEVSDE